MKYKLCTQKEIEEDFKNKSIAGGLSYGNTISIFILPNKLEDEAECTTQILVHEYLHCFLTKIIDEETSIKLDNIHRLFCVFDARENKWHYIIDFVIKLLKSPSI